MVFSDERADLSVFGWSVYVKEKEKNIVLLLTLK